MNTNQLFWNIDSLIFKYYEFKNYFTVSENIKNGYTTYQYKINNIIALNLHLRYYRCNIMEFILESDDRKVINIIKEVCQKQKFNTFNDINSEQTLIIKRNI
jgi:hypothetical protein